MDDYETLEGGSLGIERLTFEANLEVKADHDDDEVEGTFVGMASTFGNKDLMGDIIEPGAFKRSLKRRPAGKIKLLSQHRPDQVLGVILEAEETERGLKIKGQLALGTQAGREHFELMKMRALDALSIGFRIPKDGVEFDDQRGVRILKEIDLLEISVVTFAANPRARITSAKSIVPFEDLDLADRARPWSRSRAEARVRRWAGAEDAPNAKYRQAFVLHDRENADEFGAYKLMIADVVDGDLVAVPRGVFAAAAVLVGARGGVNISDADKVGARRHVQRYYGKMRDEFDDDSIIAPWNKMENGDFEGALADVLAATKDLIETEREFDEFLRDAGYSRKEAKVILADGFRAVRPPRDVDGSLTELIASVKRAVGTLAA